MKKRLLSLVLALTMCVLFLSVMCTHTVYAAETYTIKFAMPKEYLGNLRVTDGRSIKLFNTSEPDTNMTDTQEDVIIDGVEYRIFSTSTSNVPKAGTTKSSSTNFRVYCKISGQSKTSLWFSSDTWQTGDNVIAVPQDFKVDKETGYIKFYTAVKFDANNGTGTMTDQYFALGEAQKLSTNTFTREGFTFAGWNTKADGTGDNFTDKQEITVTSGMTLYAVWVDSSITTGTQTGTLTYGTASSATYDVTLVGVTEPDSFTVAWYDKDDQSISTPTGITTSYSKETDKFTINTTADTPEGTYKFTLTSSDVTSDMAILTIYSCTFGGCDWNITDDGTLTIKPSSTPESGFTSGQLPNDKTEQTQWPWYNYNDNITKVVVATGVKSGNSLAHMFYDSNSGGYKNLAEVDLSGLDFTNTENMSNMFAVCEKLTKITWPETLNTSKVTNMINIFMGDKNLNAITRISYIKKLLENNKGNCTDWTAGLFSSCTESELDLNKVLAGLDMSNVTDMSYMFSGCNNLNTIKWPNNFDASNVTDMSFMFSDCSTITSLDLSNFNTSNVTDMSFMFSGCKALTTIYVGKGWSTDKVTDSMRMFRSCSELVGGATTTYDSQKTNKTYALIDGGEDNPGYLTAKYTVIYDDNGATSGTMDSQLFIQDSLTQGLTQKLNKNTFTRDNYTFAGWSKDPSATVATYTDQQEITANENMTLYAVWTPDAYTITYKDQGDKTFTGTHEEGYPTKHTYDTKTTLDEPTKTDYVFDGYYLDSACTGTKLTELTATGYTDNITLYAKWVVPSIAVGTQTGTLTYGTASSATYDVTLVGVTEPDSFTVSWYDKDGKALSNAPTGVTISYNKTTDKLTVNTSAAAPAGTYKFTLTSGEVTSDKATLTVDKAKVTVTADNASKVNGAQDPDKFTATVTGLIAGDKLTYTVKRDAGENVGSYTITASGDAEQGNYKVTYVSGLFTINSAPNAENKIDTKALENINKNIQKENPNSKVNVGFVISKATNEDDLAKIKLAAGNKKFVAYDASLVINVDGQTVENAGSTNTELITVVYSFDFTNKKNVQVLRVHNGNVDELSETPNAKGEFAEFDEEEGTITTTSMGFSTYAFVYETVEKSPATGDNSIYLIAAMIISGLAMLVIKKKSLNQNK